MTPFLFVILAACDREPTRLVDCQDLACRVAWLERHNQTPPEQIHEAFDQIPVSQERELLVMQLVEAAPGRTGVLCPLLEAEATKRRCMAIQDRPHLRMDLPSGRAIDDTPDQGPQPRRPLPREGVPSPLADTAPLVATCDSTADLNSCQSSWASKMARRRNPALLAAYCKGMSEPQWVEECMFMGAETIAKQAGSDGYSSAADLCLLSGQFASNCQVHLVVQMVVGLADKMRGTDNWAQALTATERIHARWNEDDRDFGNLMASRFWAEATHRAYFRPGPVSGDLLDILPPEATPHVRAAVAWSLLMSERDEQRGLYEWTTRLGEVLELRIGPPPPSADGPHFLQVADAWPEKLTSQDLDETQPYLSQTQRSVSADPVVDRTLCVLEAGARILEDPTLLLAEGTSHPNPQVAWTAQRLLDYPPNLPGLEHEPGQPLDQQARGRDPRRRPAQRDGRRKNTPR